MATRTILVRSLVLFLGASCVLGQSQHTAEALVLVKARTGEITQVQRDAEVAAFQNLASNTFKTAGTFRVQRSPDSKGFIRLLVTTLNPLTSVDVCNRIAAEFCTAALRTGAISRVFVEKATAWTPSGRGTPPTPLISRDALRMEREASALYAAGREREALQKYKEVLRLHPDITHVRQRVDELTRTTNPRAWFDKRPSDWGAWMEVFAELINSNLLDEATAHLDKLPDGYKRQKYEDSIEQRRKAIELQKMN